MQLHRFPFPHDRWQEEVSVGIITKSYASLSSIIQINKNEHGPNFLFMEMEVSKGGLNCFTFRV